MARFAEAALAAGPKPARDVAFCLSTLTLSEKAFKKFMESWKLYEPALYDKVRLRVTRYPISIWEMTVSI